MREEKDPSTGMPVTLFTLQSIYAQNADEELLFQLNSGRMDMVANEYTTSPELERQVLTQHLHFLTHV
jgi:mitotic spindle assembly checkpoint protein MAD1